MVLQNFESFRSHTGFVTWLVDTTPPGVVADMFVEVANAELATTLDGLVSKHAWDWVDHIPAAQGFPQLADFATAITKDTAEKQKITARLGPMAADEKAQARFRAAHTADVTTVLAGNPTLRDLVDAISSTLCLAASAFGRSRAGSLEPPPPRALTLCWSVWRPGVTRSGS